MEKNLLKVHFKLNQNEDGYPPFSSEAIWCEKLEEHQFRVDNIPFFVTGVSFLDIVSVHEEPEGYLNFDQLVEESGHSTIRVIFLDNADDRRPLEVRSHELARQLEVLGCGVSVSPPPLLLAIDIPPTLAIGPVRRLLATGEERGFWSYEEGTLIHSTD
jgi:hypothetical protein